MKRKRLLILFGSICLMLILVAIPLITACAPAAPEKTTIEKTKIELLAGRPGDAFTVLTYALASFINEDSEWLKASVVSTGGVADSTKILIEEPARRARATSLGWTLEARGLREEVNFYPLFIGRQTRPLQLWVTYDKNIKTLEDFAGKVVSVPRKVPRYWDFWAGLLEDAGVLDKMRFTHSGLGGNATALIDGTVDIAFTLFDVIYPEIKPSSYVEKMSIRGELYFVDMGKERINRVAQQQGHPPLAVEVPAGSFGPTQDRTIYAASFSYWWGAGLEMSEDIAYEIARIAYDHATKGDFADFHAGGAYIVPEHLPYGDWQTKEEIEYWYHPGALKFYREIGVPGL